MPETQRKDTPERALKIYRNLNALGAVALFGAGVVFPEYQGVLFTLAAIDVAQVVGTEMVIRWRRRRTGQAAVKA